MNTQDCGEHEVSYTYFVSNMAAGVRFVITDAGEDHLEKYPHKHYAEEHTWTDAKGKTHIYYSCKRCGCVWGDPPSGVPVTCYGGKECPEGYYKNPKALGADIYLSAHPPVKISCPIPAIFTFVSQDPPGTPVEIKAWATTGRLAKDDQIAWQVLDNPDDPIDSGNPVPQETMAGETITFSPNPPAAPEGRGEPLSYKINAKVQAYGRTFYAEPVVIITQDERDQCRQEYIDMGKARVPVRGEFSNSGEPDHFTFDELNWGDYSWAILTDALYTGLEATRTNYGHFMDVRSGYRNPIHNASLDPPGKPESRHIYGLAADIYVRDLNGNGKIDRSEWDVLADAAELAGAWVEPWELTKLWVHMDWGH